MKHKIDLIFRDKNMQSLKLTTNTTSNISKVLRVTYVKELQGNPINLFLTRLFFSRLLNKRIESAIHLSDNKGSVHTKENKLKFLHVILYHDINLSKKKQMIAKK